MPYRIENPMINHAPDGYAAQAGLRCDPPAGR
jgi:hypothetical protein